LLISTLCSEGISTVEIPFEPFKEEKVMTEQKTTKETPVKEEVKEAPVKEKAKATTPPVKKDKVATPSKEDVKDASASKEDDGLTALYNEMKEAKDKYEALRKKIVEKEAAMVKKASVNASIKELLQASNKAAKDTYDRRGYMGPRK
jgi:hypothetical protein